jgi:hypothetical protein
MRLTRRQLLASTLALGVAALLPRPPAPAPVPAAPGLGLAALAVAVAPADWRAIFPEHGRLA